MKRLKMMDHIKILISILLLAFTTLSFAITCPTFSSITHYRTQGWTLFTNDNVRGVHQANSHEQERFNKDDLSPSLVPQHR